MASRQSEMCLAIRLPALAGEGVELQTDAGAIWRHSPGAPPDGLRCGPLWQRIDDHWPDRRAIASEVGAELGRWLYGGRGPDFLRGQLAAWSDAEPMRRIELRVPPALADWPWELATLEGIGPPAV